MIDHRLLNERLREWLATAAGDEVGLMEGERTYMEPGPYLKPFAYIEPLTGTNYTPGWGGTWKQAEVPYAFYSIGPDKQSASFLQSKLHNIFLDQSAYPMTLLGFAVLDRRPDGGPDTPEKVATDMFSIREPFILHVSVSS